MSVKLFHVSKGGAREKRVTASKLLRCSLLDTVSNDLSQSYIILYLTKLHCALNTTVLLLAL